MVRNQRNCWFFYHRGAPFRARPLRFQEHVEGPETDDQLVGARERPLDAALVGEEHVVTGQQRRAVQPNIRDSGQAVESQHQHLVGCRRLRGKEQPIPPILGIKALRRAVQAP